MNVLISVDIEGVAGVFHPEQTRAGTGEYERARGWMTQEANAAIAGAFDAGATDVLVNDSHGHFRNMPGEGDLPVRAFMQAVAATGYDGYLTLEIFNDQFRGGSAKAISADGRRSLVWLMDQVRREEPVLDLAVPAMPDRIGVEGVEFIEFAADRRGAAELASLLGTLGFVEAEFSGSVWFRSSFFEGPVRFRGARFGWEAGLGDCRYRGPADFAEVDFADNAGFENAIFEQSATFADTRFCQAAWFSGVQFRGEAVFDRTRFLGRRHFDGIAVSVPQTPVATQAAVLERLRAAFSG